MKVLERRIKENINKHVDFIEENIDYFTIRDISIIKDEIHRINEIYKSVETLYTQDIIDTRCFNSLTNYFNNVIGKLYKCKYKVRGGNNAIINLFIREFL